MCHFFSLSIWNMVLVGMVLPKASLPTCPIMVLSPLSCTLKLRGIPTLLRLSRSSWLKALHSGPSLIMLSAITRPQPPHIRSPEPPSMMMCLLPHSGHRSSLLILLTVFNIIFLHLETYSLGIPRAAAEY